MSERLLRAGLRVVEAALWIALMVGTFVWLAGQDVPTKFIYYNF